MNQSGIGKSLVILMSGVAAALVATALFSNGRQTTSGIQAVGTAGQNLELGSLGQSG